MKLSILMAAYNEERTVVQAAASVLNTEFPCPIELIVVDDGSTDRTPELLAHISDPRLIVHRHAVNRGKSAALSTALGLATGTHMLPFDADLEYSADDIPKLLEPVISGRCEVVYGTRLFGANTVYQSFRYAIGNKLLTLAANILFDSYISDLHTCLKLVPLPLVRSLRLGASGFGMDTELTARLLRAGVRPFEVPVSYHSRSREEGKKISWQDGFHCLFILAGVRLSAKPRTRQPLPASYRPVPSAVLADSVPALGPAVLGNGLGNGLGSGLTSGLGAGMGTGLGSGLGSGLTSAAMLAADPPELVNAPLLSLGEG